MLLIHSTQMSHRESLQWQNHPSIHFVNHLPNARGLKPLRERSGKFWVRGQSIIELTNAQGHRNIRTHSHDNFRIKNEHALRKLMEAAEEHEISTQRQPQSTSSFRTSVRRPPKLYSLQSAWQCKVKNNKTSPSAVQNNDYVALNYAVKHKKHFKV